MYRLFTIAAVSLATSLSAAEQRTLQVETFRVPVSQLKDLIQRPGNSLRAELQNLWQAKKAALVDSHVVALHPEDQTTLYSYTEEVVPLEFEFPTFECGPTNGPSSPSHKGLDPAPKHRQILNPTAFEFLYQGSRLSVKNQPGYVQRLSLTETSPAITTYKKLYKDKYGWIKLALKSAPRRSTDNLLPNSANSYQLLSISPSRPPFSNNFFIITLVKLHS